jgi:CO/xanthine dehydrogenase FAD-binding subunit
MRILEGETPNESAIEAAADTASQQDITPFGNIHASPEFQRHLARVITRRALKLASQRAAQDHRQ